MIDIAYMAVMARYNRWQNDNLYGAADTLDDASRRLNRGAFFGSIHATLSHLVWADTMWLSRFIGTPKPRVGQAGSSSYIAEWADLKAERQRLDDLFDQFAREVSPGWLAGDITWFSGSAQQDMSMPAWLLVTHAFNHQTHHRGQVHAMLTAAGARPGDTDLMLIDLPR